MYHFVAVTALSLSFVFMPAPSASSPKPGNKYAEAQMNLLQSYPCLHPQERLLDIKEVVSAEEYKNIPIKTLIPHAVLLHTCHSAGYCDTAEETCSHAAADDVIVEVGDFTKNTVTPYTLNVKNHTGCRCSNNNSKPKP